MKSLKSKANQLAKVKSAKEEPPPDTVSPSTPALEELIERVNLLQKNAFS